MVNILGQRAGMAVLVHVAFAAMLLFTLDWNSTPEPVGSEPDPLKAVVIEAEAVEREIEKLQARERAERAVRHHRGVI